MEDDIRRLRSAAGETPAYQPVNIEPTPPTVNTPVVSPRTPDGVISAYAKSLQPPQSPVATTSPPTTQVRTDVPGADFFRDQVGEAAHAFKQGQISRGLGIGARAAITAPAVVPFEAGQRVLSELAPVGGAIKNFFQGFTGSEGGDSGGPSPVLTPADSKVRRFVQLAPGEREGGAIAPPGPIAAPTIAPAAPATATTQLSGPITEALQRSGLTPKEITNAQPFPEGRTNPHTGVFERAALPGAGVYRITDPNAGNAFVRVGEGGRRHIIVAGDPAAAQQFEAEKVAKAQVAEQQAREDAARRYTENVQQALSNILRDPNDPARPQAASGLVSLANSDLPRKEAETRRQQAQRQGTLHGAQANEALARSDRERAQTQQLITQEAERAQALELQRQIVEETDAKKRQVLERRLAAITGKARQQKFQIVTEEYATSQGLPVKRSYIVSADEDGNPVLRPLERLLAQQATGISREAALDAVKRGADVAKVNERLKAAGLRPISGADTPKEKSEFEEGRVYRDANGNLARYVNGTFQPMK